MTEKHGPAHGHGGPISGVSESHSHPEPPHHHAAKEYSPPLWRVEDREDTPTLIAPDGREYELNFDVSGDITEAVALASERAAALVAAINQAPLEVELVKALEWALGWLPQTPLPSDQPTREEFAERLYQAEQLLTCARTEDKAQ